MSCSLLNKGPALFSKTDMYKHFLGNEWLQAAYLRIRQTLKQGSFAVLHTHTSTQGKEQMNQITK